VKPLNHSGEEPESVVPDHVIALSLNQACARLQLSRPNVVRLIKTGQLRAVKVGRKWLVSVASIRHFVEGEAS
jgi:excisionase family DNA binding protein